MLTNIDILISKTPSFNQHCKEKIDADKHWEHTGSTVGNSEDH